MTDETGLAAALRVKDRDLKAGEPPDFDALADTALAWVDARLADPATVEAVAAALHRERHQGMPCSDFDSRFNCWDADKATEQAPAALAVVRGLLGGTGGEGV